MKTALAIVAAACWLSGCTEEKTVVAPPVDHLAPRLEWIAPESGAELNETVELTFTAYDEGGISRLNIYRNGFSPPDWSIPASEDTLYTVTWDTREVDDGDFILEVRAWDVAGNVGISPALVVRVVNRHPSTIEWLSPRPGGELSGEVELRFRISEGVGMDSVRVFKNGCTPPEFYLPGHPEEDYRLLWDTAADSDGVYILEIRAWDVAGRLVVSPALLVLVKNNPDPPPEDRTPPLTAWVSPEPGSEVEGTVQLRFQILDDIGVDSVRVYKNGFSPPEFYLSGHPELDYQLIWETAADSDGVYLLEVRAWDEAGNMGTSPSLLVIVRNNPEPPPDLTPPDVWWTAPEPGSTLQDTVRMQVRVYDESGVDSARLLKNGAVVVTFPTYASRACPGESRGEGQRGGRYRLWGESPPLTPPPLRRGGRIVASVVQDTLTYLWDTCADSDGVYIWETRAWDAAGNVGISPALLVRVKNYEGPPPDDHTPPAVAWRSPEPGSEVEGTVELRCDALDDDAVDSVMFFINGRSPDGFTLPGHPEVGYSVFWATDSVEDGSYFIEVRAWDRSGNIGSAPAVLLQVWNRRPRLIWVPDDYETIQEAINASEDGDTVRVRPGTYREGLRLMGKNIRLESEEGPEHTTIDGRKFGVGILCWEGEGLGTIIRGFTFITEWHGINVLNPSRVSIYNSIFKDNPQYGVWMDDSNTNIFNCIFDGCQVGGIGLAYSNGKIRNSIFVNNAYGIMNYRYWNTTLDYGWSLFWQNDSSDYYRLEASPNDIEGDPLFIEGTYHLSNDSPAIDAGDPSILDLDRSRSDIGVYGGPFAYNNN